MTFSNYAYYKLWGLVKVYLQYICVWRPSVALCILTVTQSTLPKDHYICVKNNQCKEIDRINTELLHVKKKTESDQLLIQVMVSNAN